MGDSRLTSLAHMHFSKGVEVPFLELAAEWEAAQPRNLHLLPLAKIFEEQDREDGVEIDDEEDDSDDDL